MHFRRCSCTRLVSRRFLVASSVLTAIVAASSPLSAYAFVRFSNGPAALSWPGATVTPVPFAISTAHPAPGIADGSADAAIRMAFKRWESSSGSSIHFQEDLRPDQRARTDWTSADLHLVWFDADDSSGVFGSNAGLVALTPLSFYGGAIVDADIIFNAKDHTFSTNGKPGTFDVQNIATHEVGHFIGLDHSPVLGATMNPFAVANDTRLRTLEKDDMAGAQTIYPSGTTLGSISGWVVHASGGPIPGAHLVAQDSAGAPASSALSMGDGSFVIYGLPQGSYTVYAEPLDGPVVGHNLALGISGLAIDTGFGTTFLGGVTNPTSVFVNTGASTTVGTIVARASVGMTITSSSPNAVHAGDTTTLLGTGAGLQSGDAVSITGAGVSVTGATVSASSFSVTVSVDPGAQAGLRSIQIVRSSTGDARMLTGGVEVRGEAPRLSGVSPTTGGAGTQVTLTGTNLGSNGTVILGSGIVESPQASGTSVTFACPDVPDGTYDVTFQNQDGQFAAITQAFTVTGSTTASSSSTGSSSSSSSSQNGTALSQSGASQDGSSSAQGAAAPVPMGGGGRGSSGCALSRGESAPSSLAPLLLATLALALVRLARPRATSS